MTLEHSPLLVTDDDQLLAEVSRLAAAAGVPLAEARDSTTALAAWLAAPLVLVGTDRLADLARLRPPRRAGVHVLGSGCVPDEAFRDALHVGAETVAELPQSDTWLVELLTDVGDGSTAVGTTIAVVGGSGGAGATVFAAALATSAAQRGSALLVDADLMGPGLDRVLGLERAKGIRWDSLLQATGRLSARSLRESLPGRDDLRVLGWPRERPRSLPAFAAREVLSAGVRGFDTVVLDLPRHADPVTDELLGRCDHVVLVSPLTVSGAAAASRVAARLPAGPQRHLVTRGSGGLAPDDVARLLGLDLLLPMGDQRGLDEAVDLGAGPLRRSRGVLARTARLSLDRLLAPGLAA